MKQNLLKMLIVISLLPILSCNQPETKIQEDSIAYNYLNDDEVGIKTGGVKVIPIKTPKGTFNVWTKQFGNNAKIKVLLLNGGPGATHEYFECLESFFPQQEIEFIYYDQLACGNSDNPKDTSLYDLDRYVDEVEQLRVALGLNKNNFYLLGHSWGGILAMQYALKYQDNMKALIISDMMCSAPDYGKYAEDVLSKTMNPEVLDSIRLLEKNKDFNNPRYMELLMPNFYAQHICRIPLDKWPEPLNRSLGKLNNELYVMMQGPSEFGISGKLEKWDVKNELKNLTVPTLTIGAKYDTMDPEHMKMMSTLVQNGSYLYCPNGSHCCLYDDQQVYMAGLIKFIKEIDGGKKKVEL